MKQPGVAEWVSVMDRNGFEVDLPLRLALAEDRQTPCRPAKLLAASSSLSAGASTAHARASGSRQAQLHRGVMNQHLLDSAPYFSKL